MGCYEENKRCYNVKCYRVSEHVTPEHAIRAQGLFWAEGNWELADARGALCPPPCWLNTGHRVPLPKTTPLLSLTRKKTTLITRDSDGTDISQMTKQAAQKKPYLPLVSAISSHNWPLWEAQTSFFLGGGSNHCSTIYCPLLKWYLSFWV